MPVRRYGRRSVETSNEDKLLFREPGITKGDLIDYYERVAEHLLPHLAERPLTVRRFPDGIDAEGFYQKQASDHLPDWVRTTEVALRGSGGAQQLVVCDCESTLAYLANQACIELHPWLSRDDRPDHPDVLIIDLDPPEDGFDAARDAALRVRDLLEGELALPCFAKLSGSKGVHVTVPLDRSGDFDGVRALARDAMELLASRHGEALTVEQRKARRRGRVYLDTGRNAYGQTAVAPFSVRALPQAPVAAPIAWRQLERRELGPRDYTLRNLFRRIGRRDDPWQGMRRRAHALGPARERMDRLRSDAGEEGG